jgi:ketosteroid isomerase-like protein
MSTDANKQLVLDTLAALAAGDYARMLENLTEDVSFYVIGSTRYSGLYQGRQALLQKVLLPIGSQRDESGFSEQILNIVGEGDVVVTESRGQKTTTSGKLYSNEYAFIYRVRDGKIAEWRCYLDTQLLSDTHV